jgi:hypothetical protein
MPVEGEALEYSQKKTKLSVDARPRWKNARESQRGTKDMQQPGNLGTPKQRNPQLGRLRGQSQAVMV